MRWIVTGLETALNAKADDADLIPFITESEADAKYAIKGDAGGTIAAAWGDIAGTLANQTDLQTALNAKADDADLAGKANLADLAAKANTADVYPKTTTYNKTEIDAALAGKADDADLAAKADAAALTAYITEANADLKYEAKGQGATGAAWGEITGTISAQTDLQAALDAKADDADLAAKADAADLATKADASALTTKANSADVYTKTQTYNKTEVDAIVTGITEGGGTVVQDNLISSKQHAALSANQGRILNETKANAADLAAKADTVRIHALQMCRIAAGLDGKVNTVHRNALDVTGLQAGLDESKYSP